MSKKIIGDPLIINGRKLSLSKAVRAGDFVYLTGQVPMKNGVVITEGSIEEQTRIVLDEIKNTIYDLKKIDCDQITIGQYLRPSFNHLAVKKYWDPSEFEYLYRFSKELGF